MLYRSKRNKYGSKKSLCLLKHVHDSRFEANYCNRLFAMKQHREIIDFKIQVPFDLKVNGALVCVHIVDFLVAKGGLGWEVHEAKGPKVAQTDTWRIKKKLFEALNPHVPYIVIEKAENKSWTARIKRRSSSRK